MNNENSCYRLYDSGVQKLSEALTALKSLERIFINCTRCRFITDAGMAYLGKAFENLIFLQDATIDFSEYNAK